MSENEQVVGGEIISATDALVRAEIDMQISTAKNYPRSMEKFKRGAIAMATLDDETAASCIYRRPVGKDDGVMKFAEGMSVRMSEIVAANYGNLRVQATLVEQTERYVKARGMAIDLEANYAASSEVVESTVDKYGKPFSERMRVVIAKSALAKAARDATFKVVPRALAKPVEAAVRRIMVGDAKSLGQRRDAAMQWINKLSIDGARVFAALGIEGPSDMTDDHLLTLTGLRTAIRDGETTIDEAFPETATELPPGKINFRKRAEKPAAQAAPQPEPEPAAPEDAQPDESPAEQAEQAAPEPSSDAPIPAAPLLGMEENEKAKSLAASLWGRARLRGWTRDNLGLICAHAVFAGWGLADIDHYVEQGAAPAAIYAAIVADMEAGG